MLSKKMVLPGLALSGLLFIVGGCQKDALSNSPKRNENACTLSGKLDGADWCGELEEAYLNEDGDLVLNASNPGNKPGVDVDQVTLYLPEFNGAGTYDLPAEGAVYREWCCFDMLVTCIYSEETTGLDRAVVDSYDPATGAIQGTFYFQVEKGSKAVSFTEGRFDGVVRE